MEEEDSHYCIYEWRVSGRNLSMLKRSSNGHISEDKTYSVVAIEYADGAPILDMEEAYGKMNIFVSSLIKGYDPKDYNAASMHGGYTDAIRDGILYRMVECDNVEMFADCGLYLCAVDSSFFNVEAYDYNKLTGEIARNEAYEGLNALFTLPIDASKGDPVAAEDYVESLGIKESNISAENVAIEVDDPLALEIAGDSEKGIEVAEYAIQFVGNPYVWGGNSLTEGADYSGFVKSVYEHFEVELPHSAVRAREEGYPVESLENAQPGDLIYYDQPSHVAIYIGDGKIVHADPEIKSVVLAVWEHFPSIESRASVCKWWHWLPKP